MKRWNLVIVLAFAPALLISLAAAAANADEVPARVFHIAVFSGAPRSHPANLAFEDRLRELGYVEGRNLTMEHVQDDRLCRLAAAVSGCGGWGLVVIVLGTDGILKAAITATAARST